MHIILIPALMGAGFLVGKMLRKGKEQPSRVLNRDDNVLNVQFGTFDLWDTSKPSSRLEPELVT